MKSVSNDIIKFTKKDVMTYLDRAIDYWRARRKKGSKMAIHYIDAFQCVRVSVFGELKK